MGTDIDRINFSKNDFQQFQGKLIQQLRELKSTLEDPSFGQGSASLGAELELYIVDQNGAPLPINESILNHAKDSSLAPELNSYNLEYNFTPCKVASSPFSTLEKNLVTKLSELNNLAAQFKGRMVAIGILPTLGKNHLGPKFMTQRKRYHALVEQLIKNRGAKFHINIHGEDSFQYTLSDITLEGANTSLQIHYQVKPQDYAQTYNSIPWFRIISAIFMRRGQLV